MKLTILFSLFFFLNCYSQKLTGVVKDVDGKPVEFVNVVNNKETTVTNNEGKFIIQGTTGNELLFSSFGFVDKKIVFTNLNQIVVLDRSVEQLQEVQVIGYGTVKTVDNTASIKTIKTQDIESRKVQNALQSVQGKVAGVLISTSDAPGGQPSVLFRGLNSIEGGRSPLYIVDGQPVGNISNINSSDIESIDFLKDASALAIYGNRGANGVIIVTTKKGKQGKAQLIFESFMGIRTFLKDVKLAGSNNYALYTNLAIGELTFSQDQPVNTNWLKEITRIGQYSQNDISISGASDKVSYLFSASFYNEDAILEGQQYNRLTVRNNNKYKITDNIYLKNNINVGVVNNLPKPFSAFTAAYKQSPIVPVRFESGKYGVPFVAQTGFAAETGSRFNNVANPLALLNFANDQLRNYNLLGGLELGITLTNYLKFTSNFALEYNIFKAVSFTDSKNIYLSEDPTRTEGQYLSLVPEQPINLLSKTNSNTFNYNFSNYVTFNKVFSEIHDVELTAGTETFYDRGTEYTGITYRNVPEFENYWYQNFSTSILSNVINEGKSDASRLLSFFGRAKYKFAKKYLVSATLRRDGSSKFQKDYRWGTFPAVGLGWIVSKEGFLDNNKFVNFLKLRGSWGKLGNANVPLNTVPFSSGLNYSFNQNTPPAFGNTVQSVVDPALSWEVIEEYSTGIDFTIIKNLSGTFDVYNKTTKNLIIPTSPLLTSGNLANTYASVGQVSNKGYELALKWEDKIGKSFSYFISGNYSKNKNNLDKLSTDVSSQIGGFLNNGQFTKQLNINAVGLPLGSFFLWEQSGVDADGNLTFVDKDGQIVAQDALTNADRKFFGSVVADSFYGFSIGFKYNNFDISADAYGTMGSKVYNGKKAQRFSGENIEYDLAANFYSSTNTTSTNPAPFNAVPIASTYYLESGDFLRINNISVGYTIPGKKYSVRIYANAINPFIFQKFSGFNPELNNDGNPFGNQGIELDAFPSLRSFVGGIKINL